MKVTNSNNGTTISAARTVKVEGTTVSGNVYYIHSDHLDTPREITNEQNQTVWKNPPLTEPFGSTPVDDDPDGDGQAFTFNLRFPGQYYDRETGTHYNYYRDNYLPEFGRYGQSDPIGLDGGINTYLYVNGNPLLYIDPLGLEPNPVCVAACVGVGALIGGSAGTLIGGAGGGISGGMAGALLGPGGTIGGGVTGAQAGATTLGPLGAAAGGSVGGAAGQAMCPDNDDKCEKLGKQARGIARVVEEHIDGDHFHSKPCINLNQVLSQAAASSCDLSKPNFQYAIGVFNAVCTNPVRFPPPYGGKPGGPPYPQR